MDRVKEDRRSVTLANRTAVIIDASQGACALCASSRVQLGDNHEEAGILRVIYWEKRVRGAPRALGGAMMNVDHVVFKIWLISY